MGRYLRLERGHLVDAAGILKVQQGATAMIHAALRSDRPALAHLVSTASPEHLRALAAACAIFAAAMGHDLGEISPSLDYDAGLRTIALHLAATDI